MLEEGEVAAPPLPAAGAGAAATGGALEPEEEEVPLPAGRLPPTPPSIVKGPAKARSGDVPSSKASIREEKLIIATN